MHGQARAIGRDIAVDAHRAGKVELGTEGLRPAGKRGIGHVDIGDADGGAGGQQLGDLGDLHLEHGAAAAIGLAAREGGHEVEAPVLKGLAAREGLFQPRPAEDVGELVLGAFDIERLAGEIVSGEGLGREGAEQGLQLAAGEGRGRSGRVRRAGAEQGMEVCLGHGICAAAITLR